MSRWGARFDLLFFTGLLALFQGAAWAQTASTEGSGVNVPHLAVPAGRQQLPLSVWLQPDVLLASVCTRQPCPEGSQQSIALPPGADTAQAQLAVLQLGALRYAAHIAVPLAAGGTHELLLAAGIGLATVQVLFEATTPSTAGASGEPLQFERLSVRRRGSMSRVLVGQVNSELTLCGREALLSPRLLVGADLTFHPAKLQRLSRDERRAAPVLRAQPAPRPEPSSLLRALGASSAVRPPAALTDGQESTWWAEARGGDGRGEFALLSAPAAVGLSALDFLVQPITEGDSPLVSPQVLWLATRDRLFRVHLLPSVPGEWQRVVLPEAVHTDCLAVVLERAFGADNDSAQVGLAELRAHSVLSEVASEELIAQLSRSGPEGDAASAALRLRGPQAIQKVVAAFSALDGLGRARALEVVSPRACQEGAPLFARLLADAEPAITRRAAERLAGCERATIQPALVEMLSQVEEVTPELLTTLLPLAPRLTVRRALAALVGSSGKERASYRDVMVRAARDQRSESAFRKALAEAELPHSASIELLRAAQGHLVRLRPQSLAAFERARAARDFASRFHLVPIAAELVGVQPAASPYLVQALRDTDPQLRIAALEVAPQEPVFKAHVVSALTDPQVRVRQAAAKRAGELQLRSATELLDERIQEDEWPLVREEAVTALASLGASTAIDERLAACLTDEASSVRRACVLGLARRGAATYGSGILQRLLDPHEAASVRVAAARALGELCFQPALNSLTQQALRLRSPRLRAEELRLARAALLSLGRLGPADLDTRLQPLVATEGNALKLAVEQARAAQACSVLSPR